MATERVTASAAAAAGIGGLGVALATPFHADGSVDYESFENLIRYMAGASRPGDFPAQESGGCDFLVVLGSTGEAATVEPEERRELVRRSVAMKTGLPVIVGTGSNNTAACVRMTAEAVAQGADGVLVVVPYYNKPNPDGLVAHFRAAAQAAAGKPVVAYNVPGRTGLNMAPALLSRLWEIPNVVAVKESSGNLQQIGEICRTLPAGKALLSGDDSLALPAISLGGAGLISVAANILPARCKALVNAALAGRREEAVKLQGELLPVMDALFLESNPVPLKAAMQMLGLSGDMVRLPLAPASAATRARVAETLKPFMDSRGVHGGRE